jgi:ABC-2 type transport system ATP-binding protein
LIRELGDRHTILLSTHIMPEVEAVCGRVILIAAGRIAIDESLARLRSEEAIEVEVHGPADAIRKAIESTPEVTRVRPIPTAADGEHHAFEVRTRDGADVRERLARRLIEGGWGLRRLDLRRSTLEDRFVQAVRAAAGDVGEGEADPATTKSDQETEAA